MQQGGLALCIPFEGRPVSPRFAVALATLAYPPNFTVHYFMIEGVPVAEARQRLVEMALERNPEYILFVDDDVVFDKLALQRLIYSLSNADPKAMVIGGIYVTKQSVPVPVVFRKNGSGPSWDWKFGEVFEVEGIGAGFMLIKAAVFQHLKAPYFRWETELADQNSHFITTGEDIYFCNLVRQAGYKVLADGGVICSHFDVNSNQFFSVPPESYPMRKDISVTA